MEGDLLVDFAHAKDWLLLILSSGILFYARALVVSIQELNIKVAVVIEKVNGHEDRINRLEKRS